MKIIPHLLFAAFALAAPVQAASVDTNGPMLCAAIDLTSCKPGDTCRRETAEDLNVPRFLTVKINEGTISGSRPDGEMLATRIENHRRDDSVLVMQGIENGLSWVLTIAEQTGRMTLMAAGPDAAFVVFGACANPP